MGFFDRFRHADHGTDPEPERPSVVQIDATSLSRVFSAPIWSDGLDIDSWLLWEDNGATREYRGSNAA
jgi:hypothetical protein